MWLRRALAAAAAAALLLCLAALYAPPGRPQPPPPRQPPPEAVFWSGAAGGPFAYRFSSHSDHFPGVQVSEVGVRCLPRGAATVRSGGRLGNLIMEAASLWTAARLHNLTAFLPAQLRDRLAEVFEPLGLPVTQELLARSGCPEDALELADQRLFKVDLAATPLAQVVAQAKELHVPIVFEVCVILPETIVPLAAEVRRHFRYRPHLRRYADNKLRSLRTVVLRDSPGAKLVAAAAPAASRYCKGSGGRRTAAALRVALLQHLLGAKALPLLVPLHTPKRPPSLAEWLCTTRQWAVPQRPATQLVARAVEVVFAGMHVRRTDYAAQLRLLYDSQRPADQRFYGRAALWLNATVVPPGGALALVVASDDPAWVAEVLLPHLRALGLRHSFLAGDGLLERPERDLALLSACNHSVLAYGTFGLWSALMAGGRAAVYHLHHGDAVSPAMQFAQHIPGWVAISQ